MKSLSPGKARGLTTASSPEGVFAILAIDHRDSLRVVIDPDRPAEVSAAALTAIKLELVGALGSDATAVMLDPEYSAGQAIATRTLPGTVGFLVALEAQGYLGDPDARQTTILEGWSVEKAKRLGAAGIKLLVLYRPDVPASDRQDEMIATVVADCARHDLPLFLEPLAYPLPTDDAFAARRRRIVIDTVQRLGALGPDVLKVQFPVDTVHEPDRSLWREACAELDAAAPVPWALLSGGDPYEAFREQVEVACDAGASGFMVGRALWREAVTAAAADRQTIIDEVVRPRFRELTAIACRHGGSWTERHALPEVDETWYRTY